MRYILLVVLGLASTAAGASTQIAADLVYGLQRSVQSSQADTDGWLSATVEWRLSSRFAVGLGADHQFEDASLDTSEHLGWALYGSASYELSLGRVSPFLRVGLGVGRAPCTGDTCRDGAHVRGSAGIRALLGERFGLVAEVGASRVSRPFAGGGVFVRL